MAGFVDPERERKRLVQAKRRQQKPWVQWYRTKEWRRARAEFLERHPTCALCGAPADTVDHVRPHRGDKRLFWDSANWRAMCKACHDRKTARSDGGFGNAPGETVSSACGEDGLPSDPAHPWNRGAGGGGPRNRG